MNVLPDPVWSQLIPKVKAQCPRVTDVDVREAQQRIDLLVAKIQNRHWVSRVTAQRLILAALTDPHPG